MGIALSTLGERLSGLAGIPYLEAAVEAFRSAQLGVTRERNPKVWATLQNNIGYLLMLIGEAEDDLARFEEAIPILRDGLVLQIEMSLLARHYTEDSLCRVLLNVGQWNGDRAVLAEAKKLCETSLAGLTEAGDAAAQKAAVNLERVEAALAALE